MARNRQSRIASNADRQRRYRSRLSDNLRNRIRDSNRERQIIRRSEIPNKERESL
ncbi:hypothetical protein BB559_001909, partial [Furculomyces boomerangus]